MRVHCPSCDSDFPIEAGFLDADGKRLAAQFAAMEPMLGRAVISYLRFFKPAKNQLQTKRAVRIVQQLLDLVDAGTVCRDERGGVRRQATPATWAAGIDQMLSGAEKIEAPLSNHNYLRAVVFGLADAADAVIERKREADARVGKRRQDVAAPVDPIAEHLGWLKTQLEYGAINQEDYDQQCEETRRRAKSP